MCIRDRSGATHSGEDHDGKGLRYQKNGCDDVRLTWDKVVKLSLIHICLQLHREMSGRRNQPELPGLRLYHDKLHRQGGGTGGAACNGARCV